nr:MAG TPA: hypothetical protein [Inoviridae sp.]
MRRCNIKPKAPICRRSFFCVRIFRQLKNGSPQ